MTKIKTLSGLKRVSVTVYPQATERNILLEFENGTVELLEQDFRNMIDDAQKVLLLHKGVQRPVN